MVEYPSLMETQKLDNTTPVSPRVIPALIAGFDAVSNHIALIFIPIGLDLILWLAPRLRMKTLIDAWIAIAFQSNESFSSTEELVAMMAQIQESWVVMAERFNLLISLRSYPVGIPSLVVSSLPLNTPNGEAALVEILSPWGALLLAGVFTLIGLLGGALYFSLVAQIAVHDEIRLPKAFMDWPRSAGKAILLALAWLGLIASISIPIACGAMLFSFAGFAAGFFITTIAFGSLLMWVTFPLLFSPHGIFIHRMSVWPAIKRSLQITRLTLPTTAAFVVSIFLLSQVLDELWRIAPEDSWLMLIGIAGHAFVTTGLLSASFVYYHQADAWVESILQQEI